MIDEKIDLPDQEELLSDIGDGVTLIDFNAPWCSPCQEQRPIIELLADKFRDRALVYLLNVDDHRGPATSLGITSIPTSIIFKNGTEFQRFVGIQTEQTLSRSLEKALGESETTIIEGKNEDLGS